MHSRYNRLKAKAASERGKRMAAARWKIDRQRRDNEMPARIREMEETEIQNLPRRQGDAIGCLQWTDFRSGQVRRWVVRIGDRSDRITLHSPDGRKTKSHGWSWALSHLRRYLCGKTPNHAAATFSACGASVVLRPETLINTGGQGGIRTL